MSEWNDTEKCEYPVGDADEAIPVWVVVADEVVEAWYINPEMNVFWFEDDDENRVEATLWMETLNVFDKPNPPTTKQEE